MIRWPWRQTPERSSLNPGTRIYAVGDIHGRSDLLTDMLGRIDRDRLQRPDADIAEVYLGDYVDRGRNSRGVIDLLLARRERYPNTVCLRGNHEEVLIEFLDGQSTAQQWLTYGALETLQSYGIDLDPDARVEIQTDIRRSLFDALPPAHLRFLSGLPYSYENGDYFFVHAGIRPNVPLAEQRRDDMVWIRREFLDSPRRHEKVIVHGHTPVAEPEVLPNRINIDTGAFMTNRLTCLVLEGDAISFL